MACPQHLPRVRSTVTSDMISYNWTDRTGQYSGTAEAITSTFELVELLQSRKDVKSYSKEKRYISQGRDSIDSDWDGFHTSEELINYLRYGMCEKDTTLIQSVKKTCAELDTDEVEKLCIKKLDVCGGVPIVPLVLAGVPTCMLTMAKKRIPSRVLSVVVSVGDTCDVSANRLREVNTGIFTAIMAMEKAGYRIKLYAMTEHYYSSNDCHIYLLKLKNENQVLNLSKALYPLTEPSYFRGVSFDWHVCDPNGNADFGLGHNPCYNDDVMADAVRQAGLGHATFFKTREFTRQKMDVAKIRRACITKILAEE